MEILQLFSAAKPWQMQCIAILAMVQHLEAVMICVFIIKPDQTPTVTAIWAVVIMIRLEEA